MSTLQTEQNEEIEYLDTVSSQDIEKGLTILQRNKNRSDTVIQKKLDSLRIRLQDIRAINSTLISINTDTEPLNLNKAKIPLL